jgi:flavin reductase (DIM6/NTAB) family NADH-FMN oxidoreductase RutF
MFSSNRTPEGKRKDTVVNAEQTGFFAWNLATFGLREELNITAQQLDPGEDEFVHAKLEKENARGIPVSLVKESPVRFECQFERCIELPGNPPMGTVSILPSPFSTLIPLAFHFSSRLANLSNTTSKGRYNLWQSPRSSYL